MDKMANVELGLFFCDECRGQFKNKESLMVHIGNIHGSGLLYLCGEGECGGEYKNKESLTVHIRNVHGSGLFLCDECGGEFKYKEVLKVHIRNVHGENRPRGLFLCGKCGRQFKNKNGLTVHTRNVHGKQQPLKCDLCSQRFRQKSNLSFHFRAHHHQRIHTFKCRLCAAGFSAKTYLYRHQDRVHHRIKIACDDCGKLFGSKNAVTGHVINVHQQILPFECVVCGAKYGDASVLRSHTAVKHNGNQVQCDECNAKSGSRRDLVRHISSVHIRMCKVKCDQCPAVLSAWTHLNRHKQSVHQKRVFICDICSKPYTNKPQLVGHCFAHLGLCVFECLLCRRSFKSDGSLVRHMRMHR